MRLRALRNTATAYVFAGAGMREQDNGGYDYQRYRQLLAEAVDEQKRLALIELLIREKARDRLAAQRASDQVAMTAMTIAKVLATSPVLPDRSSPPSDPNPSPLQLLMRDVRQQGSAEPDKRVANF